MIEHNLDPVNSILYLRPTSAFAPGDFAELARTVDPFIAATGSLNGLVIDAPTFPSWQSPGAMAAHFRFGRNHHEHIGKVALVTGSALGNVAEQLASHFVAAKIRHFPASEVEAVTRWVVNQ